MRGGRGPEEIAEGVWRVQGNPGALNVYLLYDAGGLVQFDAGGRCMLAQLREAVARIGLPLREIVLGHAHVDHRGSAPWLDVPVACHPEERLDAEGSGGLRYQGIALLPRAQRLLHERILNPRFFDGGPVRIARTLDEGDSLAGFRVLHLPGHAPGLIALVRDRDGVALTTDAFYVIDAWGRPCPPRLPDEVWSQDSAAAARSLRKLAEEAMTVAWPGHGEALSGEVQEQLLRAANAPGPTTERQSP